jgi:hypothetical protein
MRKIVTFLGLMFWLIIGLVSAGFGQTQADITLALTPQLNCPNGNFDSTAGVCKEAPIREFAGDITLPITPELNCPNGRFDSTAGVGNDPPLNKYADDILIAITPALRCPDNFDGNTGLCK